MNSAARLGSTFESLEDRTVPATFGVPWADPSHLTLSFVPDGTQTPLGPSNLTHVLANAGGVTAGEMAILRAFQTWASQTNINIALVADDGEPLGTVGAVQGDSRFGDIRIASAPLSADSVANSSPFSWAGTTLSGDVMFNSNMPFGIGNNPSRYDLYSVAIHEAGHVFGLDHSTAAGSVMNENYTYHTGLSATDISSIQALYGPRQPDGIDVTSGNNSILQASSIPRASNGELLTSGDLTKSSDVDYFKFSTPLLTATLSAVTIRLKADGLSLLTAKVTVYDALGRVVTTSTTTDPTNNDLTLSFRPGLFGGTYFIKVQGARGDVFDIGSYKLAVDFLSLGGLLTPITTTLVGVLDGGTNDLLANALGIQTNKGSDARFDAVYRGVIETRSDVDSYRIRTDRFAAGTSVTLNVMVWGLDANPVDAQVRVFDANGNPIAFQVLANSHGLFSVQVLNAVAGQNYYVQVFSRQGAQQSTGTYFFAADFNQLPLMIFDNLDNGTVDSGNTTPASTLTLNEAGVYQFALGANSLTNGDTVTMMVYDENGNLVLTLKAVAGQPAVTATKYLLAGTYTIKYSGGQANSGSASYGLFLAELSDPIGPFMTATATPPSSAAPSPSPSPAPSSPSSPATSPPSYYYSQPSPTQPTGYYYSF